MYSLYVYMYTCSCVKLTCRILWKSASVRQSLSRWCVTSATRHRLLGAQCAAAQTCAGWSGREGRAWLREPSARDDPTCCRTTRLLPGCSSARWRLKWWKLQSQAKFNHSQINFTHLNTPLTLRVRLHRRGARGRLRLLARDDVTELL